MPRDGGVIQTGSSYGAVIDAMLALDAIAGPNASRDWPQNDGERLPREQRGGRRTEIVVRSMRCVGGERPGRKYERKKEFHARRRGFVTFDQMAEFMTQLQMAYMRHKASQVK